MSSNIRPNPHLVLPLTNQIFPVDANVGEGSDEDVTVLGDFERHSDLGGPVSVRDAFLDSGRFKSTV